MANDIKQINESYKNMILKKEASARLPTSMRGAKYVAPPSTQQAQDQSAEESDREMGDGYMDARCETDNRDLNTTEVIFPSGKRVSVDINFALGLVENAFENNSDTGGIDPTLEQAFNVIKAHLEQ